jgi:peptidoglycan/xylan/chitin deacetylase (PgdA/CDA1 family)
MNDRYFFNIFLVLFSSLLYVTGILYVLMKILVKKGLYVFNYHSFNTLENDYWKFGSLFSSNYQENFAKQIKFFDKYMMGIDSFQLDSIPLNKPKYMLTFDDGYKDNCQMALPVLKRNTTPAIFFIATKPIGTDALLWYDMVRYFYESKNRGRGLSPILRKKELKSKLKELKKMGAKKREETLKQMEEESRQHGPLMMDWGDIQKAHAEGILIGSHTHTHPILTSLDRDKQIEEIRASLDLIESHVNVSPCVFSYPEGDESSFNQDTIRFLKSSGILYAFTTTNGVNLDMSSPFHLRRIGVKASDPIPVTALKIIRATLLKGKSAASREDRQ